MTRRALSTLIVGAALLTGCAHTDKTSDMLAYEEARDSDRGQRVAEANPEEFSLAQEHYASALEAHDDNEPKLVAHHTKMANIHWRIAESRADTADAKEAAGVAEQRQAATEVQLSEADQRVALATTAVERLEKIAALEGRLASAEGALSSQKDIIAVREQVGNAIIAVKDAESWGAQQYAPEALEQATTSLEQATSALERNELKNARTEAKAAIRLAKKAAEQSKPKYEAEKGQLALDARKRALFEAVAKIPNASQKMTAGGVTVALHNLFASGSVQVRSEKLDTLDAIKKVADDYTDFTLVIEGHTDDRGKSARNLTLSQGRAQAVLAYLSAQGIDPARVTSVGRGSDAPVASNRSKAGRAENRRIEVLFVQKRSN